MMLLQAAMMGGLILVIIFWNFSFNLHTNFDRDIYEIVLATYRQKRKIENNISYYKDPFPFLISIAFSIFTLIVASYLLIIWFDKAVK